MRRIGVLIMIVCVWASLAGAQVTTFESKSVILKPATDKTLPLLTLEEPKADGGGMLVVGRDNCFVRGLASDAAGIRSVEVNGSALTLAEGGRFEIQLPLKEGHNSIRVYAEDNAGNHIERSIDVIRDTKPPAIEVLEPRSSETKGIRPIEKDIVTLKGRATDEYGVKLVTVNGVAVSLGSDSTFTVTDTLKEEESRLTIVAVDNAGNMARLEVPLFKHAKAVVAELLAVRNYAFIIGIDEYHGDWARLKNAVRDARAVEKTLRESFRFERIETLYDQQATRDEILGEIDKFANTLTREDNLLIYYSGHGTIQERSNRGFWVPSDADGRSTSRYISHSELKDRIAAFQGRHILVVADACFSGEILKGAPPALLTKDDPQYFRKVFQLPSRWALTSGGEEPVLDGGREGHSIFAFYFLKALQEVEGRYFTASQVYERLKFAVGNNSAQLPRYDELRDVGSEHGEFVFVRR